MRTTDDRSARRAALVCLVLLASSCTAGESPAASTTESLLATATASSGAVELPAGALEPATYYVWVRPKGARPIRVMFSVPDGWFGHDGWYLLSSAGADPPAGAGIMFWYGVLNVYADPCHWRGSLLEPAIGPTVDDFANALADQPMREAIGPTDVTIDDYHGKQVVVSVPDDIDLTDCDDATYKSWIAPDGGTRYHQGPGQIDQTMILEVAGERIMIIPAYYAGTSAEDRADLDAIVESIQIEPTS